MSGLPSGFVNGSIDLSGYFPSYEIVYRQQALYNNSFYNLQLNLTRNKNMQTNYIVIPSVYVSSGGESEIKTMSDKTYPPLINTKTSTSFKCYFTWGEAIYNTTMIVSCLVIYCDISAATRSLATSLQFNNGSADTGVDLTNHFPQYAYSEIQMYFASNSQLLQQFIYKNYTGDPLNYKLFGAYEYLSADVSQPALDVGNKLLTGQILYLTEPDWRTDSYYYLGIRNNTYGGSVDIRAVTLALFPVPSGSWTTTDSSYTTNFASNISNTSTPNILNLSSIFPRSQCYEISEGTTNTWVHGTITYNSPQATANAWIFPSYFYNKKNGTGVHIMFMTHQALLIK